MRRACSRCLRCQRLLKGSLSLRSFFFSSRRRHTRLQGDWSSDVCSSDLPEDARSTRVKGVRKDDGSVLVEADVRAVFATVRLRGAYDDRAHDFALLDATHRGRLLDGGDDDVTHRAVPAPGAANNLNTH